MAGQDPQSNSSQPPDDRPSQDDDTTGPDGRAGGLNSSLPRRQDIESGQRKSDSDAVMALVEEPSLETASSRESNQSATSSPDSEETEVVYRRRITLPVILFILTCGSTFFVGMTQWSPVASLSDCTPVIGQTEWTLTPLRQQFLTRWDDGLLYMALVMLILLAHELGHFIATLIYRVPASLPIFLPFPFNPLGTFGAVIGMQGSHADRKQIFDIGIAGPIAGLVFAVPIMLIGVQQLEFTGYHAGMVAFEAPLATRWMMEFFQPEGYVGQRHVWISQLNPYFAAGWIGFLITGINMMPISQLDGGHVTYTLFGKAAHWIARATMAIAIAFMVFTSAPTMILMVVLLLLVGTDHPPTRDDSVKLGWFRTALGLASLSIPILCFPPLIFKW